jgi:FkbM family methyltransferase
VEDYESAIQKRQKDVFGLYESIKKNGYNESEFLGFWDEDGFLHIYDGHHRLSILRYLGLDVDVNVEDEWAGLGPDAYSPSESAGFPLRDRLRLESGRVRVYQPIDDPRVSDIPIERQDSEARLAWIKERLAPGSVLDIGCSEGFFSRAFLKDGRRVVSVDIDKNLVAVSRYLSTRENLAGDFRVGKWQDNIADGFDNIIYLSVLHNEVNAVGEHAAFEGLKLLRGKCKRLFVEIPSVQMQPDWAGVFSPGKVIPRLESLLEMKVVDTMDGWRPIYMFAADEQTHVINNLFGKFALSLPDNDGFITRELKRDGVWEENTTRYIREHLKPGQTFVDVGAHAGYYTLLAADLVGPSGQVIAFEPAADNREFLENNITANGEIGKKIIVYPFALSDAQEKTVLHRNQDAGGHSLIGRGDGESVLSTRMDSALDCIPDMVKIDVEGAEMRVLAGMKNILSTERPLTIIAEDWGDKQGVSDFLGREHGFREVAKFRSDGTVILVKNQEAKRIKERLVCHLIGNIDIPTVKGGCDAFATKAAYFGRILKKMGHKVYFYGVEGSEVPCDEFIQCISAAELEAAYGKEWRSGYKMKQFDALHNRFIDTAVEEVRKRRVAADLLLLSGGTNHAPIASRCGVPLAIEIGIGYVGSFAPYRIFESHAWRHWTYGKQGLDDGRFSDCVIPPFFDPEDFEYRDEKSDYYLYIGRVVPRKGVQIAIDTVKAIGGKLKVAGPRFEYIDLSDPCVEYVGIAGPEEKRELLAGAKAVFVPTQYLEPFGYVIIEAALSGTPVITTDFGAFPDNVKHGETGYRCRTFEQFIWAAKNCGEIKPWNCRAWGAKHSLDAAIPRYEEYFEQLMNLHGRGWYALNPERDHAPIL